MRLAEAFGKKEVREYETAEGNEALKNAFTKWHDKCYAIAKQGTSKAERGNTFAEVKEEIKASFTEEELEEYGHLLENTTEKQKKKPYAN